MICKTILLLVTISIVGCNSFGKGTISPVQSNRDRLHRESTRQELESRVRTSLTHFGTRRMEIWWDGRDENLEPPTELFEGAGNNLDKWIVAGDKVPGKSSDSAVEMFQADGNQLKDISSKSVLGAIVRLKDSSGQEQALAVLGSVEWLLVEVDEESKDAEAWQMIPAENIISAAQSTGTKVAFVVKKSADVPGLAKALELGVDALCISTRNGDKDPDLWKTAFEARKDRNAEAEKESASSSSGTTKSKPEVEIIVGSCWRRDTKGTVLADRICVDLVQKLRPEEGCWVGSSAKIMALVLSEAASSQFVPTRPFRVNAGPVHSYILLGDGITTKYLCELQPSDQVLVHNTQTKSSRPVAVGRLKEEIRPCVLVELETPHNDDSGNGVDPRGQVFLQQAETVRLGQPVGKFVRVTDLEAQGGGDAISVERESVLLRIMKTGTHVGKVYTGKVEER